MATHEMGLYYISDAFIEYIRQFESRVAINKSQTRPYIGTIVIAGNHVYYAPLTSPKPKHLKMRNDIDFLKIAGGKYGAIGLNNMIPVHPNALLEVNINAIPDAKYKRLLQEQARWISENTANIQSRASRLHELLTRGPDIPFTDHELRIRSRSCDLCLLETVFMLWQPQSKDSGEQTLIVLNS